MRMWSLSPTAVARDQHDADWCCMFTATGKVLKHWRAVRRQQLPIVCLVEGPESASAVQLSFNMHQLDQSHQDKLYDDDCQPGDHYSRLMRLAQVTEDTLA